MSVPGFLIGQTLAKQAKSPTGQSLDQAAVQRLSVLGLVVGASPLGIVMLKTLADKEAEKVQPPAAAEPEIIRTPNVVEQPLDQALGVLSKVELKGIVESRPQDPSVATKVATQNPAADTLIAKGSFVVLTVVMIRADNTRPNPNDSSG